MTTVIYLFWVLAAMAKLSVVVCLYRRWLMQKYWLFALLITVSLLKQVFLFVVSLSYADQPAIRQANYTWWWSCLQPLDLGLGLATTIEAIHQIALHFPHSRKFATYVSLIFSIPVLLGVIATAHHGVPRHPGVEMMLLLFTRYSSTTFLLLLGGVSAFFSWPRLNWRPNTKRLVDGLMGMLLLEAVASGLMRAGVGHRWMIYTAHLLGLLAPLIAAAAWLRIDEDGELWTAPRPAPGLIDAIEAQERELRQAVGI